jgi:peptide/nickel transport system permease protein
MLPNAVGPIIVNATLTVALSIILETTLSYLGLGVQPPGVSLGLLVNQGQDSATTEWWLFVFPVVFLIVLILSIFLIGDGLREAFDPKKSRVRA